MQIHTVEHPLVAERLSRLRDSTTQRSDFRRLLGELSQMLIYEAMRDHPSRPVEVESPMGTAPGSSLATLPIMVPVMRAGLGMLDAALDLLPDARTGFVGMRRDEQTLLPHAYVNTVPDDLDGQDVFVLDPMLATGGSCVGTCELLHESSPGRITIICVLAAPEGLETLRASGTAEAVVTASVDERLNEVGFILPGLGDAGDRQFGLN
jgi:uracil phosphoribosyltransferase